MARRGFSLLELLVVLGLAGTLAAIVLPAAAGVRATSRSGACKTQLRTLGLVLLDYVQEHHRLPHEDSGSTRPPKDCGWADLLPPRLASKAGTGVLGCPEAEGENLSYKMNSKLCTEDDPFPRDRRIRPRDVVVFFDGRVDNRGVRRAPKGTWAMVADRHPEGAHLLMLDGSLTSHAGGVGGWTAPGPMVWEPTAR